MYTEIRISAGQPFRFCKFNIFRGEVLEQMLQNGAFIHTKELERNGGLTFVGWCLKQVYMDELPQLWCVLRGDMSIVGPRPVNTEVFERFMREGITVKAEVKAGLTGPFQSLKDDRTASAHLLDRWYIEYVTTHPWYAILWNDMRIIIRTVRVVLKARGL
jgi:lipopolysaccharide/colanic/teichoic acid biosynthesis glycosyltransferase